MSGRCEIDPIRIRKFDQANLLGSSATFELFLSRNRLLSLRVILSGAKDLKRDAVRILRSFAVCAAQDDTVM